MTLTIALLTSGTLGSAVDAAAIQTKLPAAKGPGGSPGSGSAPKGLKNTEDMTFTVEASGGTFAMEADGSITGTLSGVEEKGSWSVRESDRTGSIDTGGIMDLVGQDSDPAFIKVKGAASDQDLVSLELVTVEYNDATSAWDYTAKPLDPVINTAGNEASSSFKTDVDASIPSSFGAATLVVDNAATKTDSDGGPTPNAVVGGTVQLGLAAGVKVKFAIADGGRAFDCVETSKAPDVTTEKFGEPRDFQIDTFTFAHGCGTKPSWIVWNVTVQGDLSGQVFLGQNNAGGRYYAECRNWGGASKTCMSAWLDLAPIDSGTSLAIVPALCPRQQPDRKYPATWVVDPGSGCSTNNGNWTWVRGPRFAEVSNAGYGVCGVTDNIFQTEIPAGETGSLVADNIYAARTPDNRPCILVWTND